MWHSLTTLGTLSFLEIVLGIDNLVLLSVLTNNLPDGMRKRARSIGIALAVIMRILLLLIVNVIIIHGQTTLFILFGTAFTLKGIILIFGGLFLAYKASTEMYQKLEGQDDHLNAKEAGKSFAKVIAQIILMDMVFSLDSIITAVGLANGVLCVMITAIVIGAAVMWLFSNKVSILVEKHPSLKILALSFLMMVGFILMLEGFMPVVVHTAHLKSYMYAMMGFSLMVEMLNIRYKSKNGVVVFHEPHQSEIVSDTTE